MFGFVDVAALLTQILMQVAALVAGQCAVGFVLLFGLTNLPPAVPQLLRLIARQLTCLYSIDDSAGLIHLPPIHARISGCYGHRCRTVLRIVLLPIDVTAGLVLLMMQISPLGASELTIGFVSPLQLPNVALALGKVPSLSTSQLTGPNALPHALMLILLPSMDASISHTGLSLTQAGDSECAGEHQQDGEAAPSDVEDLHMTTRVLFPEPYNARRRGWLTEGLLSSLT